jgi:predicted PurR-regulated permease PerM
MSSAKRIPPDGVKAAERSAGRPSGAPAEPPQGPAMCVGNSASPPAVTARERVAFAWRVLVAVGLAALVVAGVLLFRAAAHVFALFFTALLLGILLRTCAVVAARHLRLRESWALALVTLLLVAALGVLGLMVAPDLSQQAHDLSQKLPEALTRLRGQLEQSQLGRAVLAGWPTQESLTADREALFSRLTGLFSTTLGFVISFAVVLLVGFYLAADPRVYLNGVVQLVAPARRARVYQVLLEIGNTLRWWILGRLVASVFMGALTATGLWLVGVPAPLPFGILAALLEFIPTIGPILSFIPPTLIALTDSPTAALWVLGVFAVVQCVESGVIIPLIEQKTVLLPPALTLTVQIVMSLLLGGIGLLLASPLVAAGLVMVKKLYVEDVLGDTCDTVADPTEMVLNEDKPA